MTRAFSLACLFVALVLVLPTRGADEKDDQKKDEPAKKKVEVTTDKEDAPKKAGDKEKDTKPKPAKKEQFTWGYELIGKLKVDGNSQKYFTLHVTSVVMEPDYGAQEQYAREQVQLQMRLLDVARARSLQDRQNAMNQYYQTAANLARSEMKLYRQKTVYTDVPLRYGENMKVRLATPPVDYDEKGKLKQYTAKELRELRGTESLPGYNGDADSLRSGQYVRVYLAKNQPTPAKVAALAKNSPKAAPAEKGKKKKTADDDDELMMSTRPEAVMIMVLQDPRPAR